jgi:SSS family solute:Na+ symporter
MPFAEGGLSALDLFVLLTYIALLAWTGWWFSRARPGDARGYFQGRGAVPPWAAGVSILATSQSAVTFIGVPQQSFRGDLSYLVATLGALLAAFIIARWFIPAYYRHAVLTPYQLLDRRFGPGARRAASIAYLVGRVFATGSRLFVGSIPVAWILFNDDSPRHIALAVGVLSAVGIVYTLAGGIRSVIWTDVIQCAVYLGAATVGAVLIWRCVNLPPWEVIDALGAAGVGGTSKLRVFHAGLDVSREFTLLTAFTGLTLLYLGAFGTDQDFVQRALTGDTARGGVRAVLWGTFLTLPATALFLVIGLLLHLYYRGPGAGTNLTDDKSVFLQFILTRMPTGLRGLMLAGLLAAGLSTVNSTLNAMASSVVADLSARGGELPAAAGRWAVVGAGIAVGLFAMACVSWYDPAKQTLLTFALNVMNFAYAGLLGVFITALFTRRGSTASVVAGLVSGFACVLLLQPGVMARWWPGGEAPQLAFPWQLVLGSGAATLVCALARGRQGAER